MDAELVEVILVPIIDKVITPVLNAIGRQISYAFCYNRNIKNFEKRVTQLEQSKTDADSFFEGQRCNNEETAEINKEWLKEVKENINDAKEIQKAIANLKGCLNLKGRFVVSRKSTKMALEMQELLNKTPKEITKNTDRPVGRLRGALANYASSSYRTRMQTMEEVMKALEDQAIHVIGICGLGGVGKTIMVHEVRERARQQNLFDYVAISTVTKNQNIFNIQRDIAEMVGLKSLKEKKNIDARADQLSIRLTGSNRVLVILDDVWRDIDLKAIGIPDGSRHTKCKVVIASRQEGVCSRIQKTIKVQMLAEEEARDLFRKKVGRQVEKNNIREIADEVADKCEGLPSALVTLSKELSNKDEREWEDARSRLRKGGLMSINGMEEVYESLKLSYDFLAMKNQEEAQSLLLLCCQHQEQFTINVEELARYCLSHDLFEGVTGVVEARNRVYSLIKLLKSCFLLQTVDADDEDKESRDEVVTMHGVVRCVCLSIVSRVNEEKDNIHTHILERETRIGNKNLIIANEQYKKAVEQYTAADIQPESKEREKGEDVDASSDICQTDELIVSSGGTKRGRVLGFGSTETEVSISSVCSMPAPAPAPASALEAQRMIDDAYRAIKDAQHAAKDAQHAAEVANKVVEDMQAKVEAFEATFKPVLAPQSNPNPHRQGS